MGEQPILVLGAPGTTGRRVAERLRAAGVEVRAASRHGYAAEAAAGGAWRS